ncbi:MAG: Na+/H+ antiporter subunit E [Rhodocyclaceae bacterium]|nr:Na+/H+ antiporter subunit E [Rhodocyclaceae bacterium]MCB1912103.1 Na+/H+ antiporter subunit E [Rhodocyclaceae bacterium]MCP5241647.1 Na+/H+ antiporter subunit E [Zoogloeaceae bacterium]MCP5255069.1 Na+/H+ antiporter subunit E [Zoogloeaceae bacterium]MCW5616190.1 Na+/H+ antiporter subunit E [Rhodocyclaceae bacterium]
MKRFIAAVLLALRFLAAVVRSGAQTTLLILRRPQRLDPGFVDYRYQPMHPTGAVLLGCLISLTPGTTTVEIDEQRHTLRLHMLDTRDVEAALTEIREQFEAPLQVLFGEKP